MIRNTRRAAIFAAMCVMGFVALAYVVHGSAVHASNADGITLQHTIVLPDNKKISSFDISWVDPVKRAYFLADRTNFSVDDVNVDTHNVTVISPPPPNNFQGAVSDPNVAGPNDVSGPNGVVTVNHNEVWAADAPSFSASIVKSTDPAVAYATDNCDSSVKVINLNTKQVTDVIDTGGCFRADEMAFDPKDQVLIVANPAEQDIGKPGTPTKPFVTLISTIPDKNGKHQILRKITFDGTGGTPNATAGIEQPVWNPRDGFFYISLPQNGANPALGGVVVINPHPARGRGRAANQIKVLRTLPVNNCAPNGTVLGPDDNEAFLGCSAGPVQVVNIRNGREIAAISQASGCDEVWFNPGDDHYLGACNFPGPTSQIAVIDAQPIMFDTGLLTNPSGSGQGAPHSVAADLVTNDIFVPLPIDDLLCGATPNNGCIAVFGR